MRNSSGNHVRRETFAIYVAKRHTEYNMHAQLV